MQRHGFVSNSSSSSFVIVGVKLDEVSDECSRRIEGKGMDCRYVEQESSYLVGYVVDEGRYNFNGNEKSARELMRMFDELETEFPGLTPKLYTGTCPS